MTDRGCGGDTCDCGHYRGEHEYLSEHDAKAKGGCETGDCDCEAFSMNWMLVEHREMDHLRRRANRAIL